MAISVGDAVLKVGVDEGDLNRGLDKVTGKIKNSTAKWSRGMKIAGGIMIGAVVAVGTASIKMASSFDSAMREVNTMMLLSEDEFKAFSKDVKGLAKDMGVDAVESAKALYQAISAGVPKENAIDFLKVATKAAIGGVTDTETAVDGLTTVINAFKLPISDAEKVADIMFTTVKGGKTTFEELSASLFQVAPIAAAANVKFEEVAAALATMTKQGVPTSVATRQLRQTMVALQKPTADMQKVISDLGYESGQAMLNELGLAEALETLRGATGGNTEMLMKMFGSVEAGSAVLALTGENAKMFATDLESMSKATGASTDAFDEMEKSVGRKMEKMKTQFKDMGISIGNALLPVLESLMEIISPIIKKVGAWIEKNPNLVKGILAAVAAIGGLLVVGGVLLPILSTIGVAFAAIVSPIGLVILAIAAAIAIGVLVWKNWDKIKEKAIEIWNKIASFFSDTWNAIKDKAIEIWNKITGFFSDTWNAIKDKTTEIWNKITGFFSDTWNTITIKIQSGWDNLIGFFKGIPEKMRVIFDTVKDIILSPFNAALRGIESGINWLIRQVNKIGFTVPEWIPIIGGKTFGIDIPEISLPGFAAGGMINEPTLLYGLKSQRPYAIAGEKGPEAVGPVGASTMNVTYNINGGDTEKLKVILKQHDRELLNIMRGGQW